MNEPACSPAKPPRRNVPRSVEATLALGIDRLSGASDSPRADAQILLAFLLGRERGWLISHGGSFLTPERCDEFAALCDRRASGEPIAYLTGIAGFYGRDFAVNDAVLVPRPETEHLVEDALTYLRARRGPDAPMRQLSTVLDVGTGSGAIGCTLAAEIPGVIVDGTDTSAAALKMAEYNARRLGVHARCRFVLADIVAAPATKSYDVVIANLPYVPSGEIPRKPDPVGFEPLAALDGGPDGLNPYRRLLAAAPRLLRPGGLLLMEAAPPTIGALAALARAALSGAQIEVRQDYGGRDRYVWAKRSPVS